MDPPALASQLSSKPLQNPKPTLRLPSLVLPYFSQDPLNTVIHSGSSIPSHTNSPVKYQNYCEYVVGLLAADSRVVKKSLVEQFKRFIVKPFAEQSLLEGETILITLDGLDECEGESALREIIFLITKFSLHHPNTPLVWIIASRPEAHISSAFSRQDVQASFLEIDMPVDSDQACSDVEHSLRDKFTEIRENYSMSFSPVQQWPTETQFVKVATRASGLFVFAETVVLFVGDAEYSNPAAQLQKVMSILDACLVFGAQENPFAALDALYTRTLSGVPSRVLPITRKLLTLLTTRRTTYFVIACNVLAINQADAYSALRKLHSVVQVPPPEQANSALRVFHTSFIDYLESQIRSGSFWTDPLETKRIWAASYVRVLLEAHDRDEAVVRTSNITISWNLKGAEISQGNAFCYALIRVMVSPSVEPEYFGNLGGFFRDIDYANLGLLSSNSSTVFLILSFLYRPQLVSYLSKLRILTIIPLQSLILGSIGSNEVSYIGSDRNDTLPGQEDLKLSSGIAAAWFENPFESLIELFDWYFKEVVLSNESGWTTHIHQHLTSMAGLLPSHPVILLGKGQKTCVIISVDSPDRSWLYVFPYRQS